MWGWGLALAALLLVADPSRAADMRLAEPIDGRPVVEIEGQIEIGDAKRFARLTGGLPPALVVLESPGGKLIDALTIGNRLHVRGDATVVRAGASCTSACALIWVAGKTRTLEAGGAVGFHAAASNEGGVLRTTASGNAIVGAYLTRLNFPLGVVIFATEADHTSMAYLTAARASRAGLPFSEVRTIKAGRGGARPRRVARDVRRFVELYLASARVPAHPQHAAAPRIYAESVRSSGRAKSRAALLAERETEAEGWANYAMARIGSPQIACEGERCSVRGTARFAGEREDERVRGTLAFELTLERAGRGYAVVDETRRVLSRRVEPRQALSGRALTTAMQERLVRLGCEPGPVDGLWGRRTRAALVRFGRTSGATLDVSGPSQSALEMLSRPDAAVCRGAPAQLAEVGLAGTGRR